MGALGPFFGALQDEDDVIDYDFLYVQTGLVANKIHDKLMQSDENLQYLTLDENGGKSEQTFTQ